MPSWGFARSALSQGTGATSRCFVSGIRSSRSQACRRASNHKRVDYRRTIQGKSIPRRRSLPRPAAPIAHGPASAGPRRESVTSPCISKIRPSNGTGIPPDYCNHWSRLPISLEMRPFYPIVLRQNLPASAFIPWGTSGRALRLRCTVTGRPCELAAGWLKPAS